MLSLGLAFIALICMALAFIVLPLLRKNPPSDSGAGIGSDVDMDLNYASVEANSRAQLNTIIYKERLAELKQEFDGDDINEAQFKDLELELQKTLLSDIPESPPLGASDDSALVSSARGYRTFSIVAAVVFSLSVVGFYTFIIKDQESLDWIVLKEKMQPVISQALYGLPMSAETEESLNYTYADFIHSLQSHLQTNQDNADAWGMLGRAYAAVNMPKFALDSYLRAYEILPRDSEVMLGLAEAKITLAQGRLDNDSRGLIDAVLRKEPNNTDALVLKGMASFSSGLYQEAIDSWERILKLQSGREMSEAAQQGIATLNKSIGLARRRLGMSMESGDSPTTKPGAGNSELFTEIKVTVDISASLKSQLSASDILYIYAKAIKGPPMPVAVARVSAAGFPVQVTLDDSSAMTQTMKLSNFSQVRVVARVSKSGQPIAQPGDLQAEGQIVTAGSEQRLVELEINSTL